MDAKSRYRFDLKFAINDCYQISGLHDDEMIRTYEILKNRHYILTDSGRILHGQPLKGILTLIPLEIDGIPSSGVRCLAVNNNCELFLVAQQRRIFCVKDDILLKCGKFSSGHDFDRLFVIRSGDPKKDWEESAAQRYYFVFSGPKAGYSWYEEQDLFEDRKEDRRSGGEKKGIFYKKGNLFGPLGQDILLNTAVMGQRILFLTRNPSRSETFVVLVDMENGTVVQSFEIKDFDVLKGIPADEGQYFFITRRNELVYLYHLNWLVEAFFAYEQQLDQSTDGKWKKWKTDKGLTEPPNARNAFSYARHSIFFLEQNPSLKDEFQSYFSLIRRAMAGKNTYGMNCIELLRLHADFRNTIGIDFYFHEGFLYILTRNRNVYQCRVG